MSFDLFSEQTTYHNFTAQHFWALTAFLVFTTSIIYWSKKYADESLQRKIALAIAFIPFIALSSRILIISYMYGFSLRLNLPLHLCRILAILGPFFIYLYHQKTLKIYYYLILAGTLNALVTAEIQFGFPHYGYFVYWLYHGGSVCLALYGIIVLRTRLSLKDGLHAFLVVNLYFGLLHLLNLLLNSNYMYSRYKPQAATLMDFLGPWPYYLLWLELIAFGIIMLIFLVFNRIYRFEKPISGQKHY